MKVATFNVESLFRRPEALSKETWSEGKPILEDYQLFNRLIAQEIYTPNTKDKLVQLLVEYNLQERNDKTSKFFILHEVREKLFKLARGAKKPEIVVNGRKEWDGWLELKRKDIESNAIENTALVIQAVQADVLAIVEAEDRIALQLFNDQVLKRFGVNYTHNMLIDGNDERGIDVGLYSQLPIVSMRSNIDAGLPDERIFSRDCAEYEITLPSGDSLWLLVNHFKSKGFGSYKSSNERRLKQATEVANIYKKRHASHRYVIVAGDFNDTPESEQLKPLIKDTDLRDVMTHEKYKNRPNARPGTFKSGSKSNKLDYILLSPALWEKVLDVDVERHGVWAPRTFEHFETVKGPADIASEHAAVWVELNLN